MIEERITLTMKEQKINDAIVKLISKENKTSDVARVLGLSERQIYRKKKRYLEIGIKSIPHKSKNKTTSKGYSKDLKDIILDLYENEYNGWNFYHFNDTLEDYHNIKVSDSFIYNLLTSNGYESPLKYKKKKKGSHPPRPRKESAGELIQVDASKHQWFVGDDNYYHLHGGIDDSTGIVTGCFFAKEETIYGYQTIMSQTIKNYGIPLCLYTDYRTVFQSNKRELSLEEELSGKEIKNTRFANMLDTLGVDIISTTNPRAKGRIERLWKTFQNRLYNELKMKNIHTIEKANEYLENVFIPKYNARFALPIDDNKNLFVCPLPCFDFNRDLAVWSEHKIYHNCYLKYDKKYHVISDNNEKVYLPTSQKQRVYTFLDGSTHLLFEDKFYDVKQVNIIKPEQVVKQYTEQVIQMNIPKTPKPNNSPWRKGLPPAPFQKKMQWAYLNGS